VRLDKTWLLSSRRRSKQQHPHLLQTYQPFQLNCDTILILAAAVGTRRATASVVGGGNINFGPSASATSLAIVRAIPQLGVFVPSVLLGLVMVGIFMAV
jgi:hypothetical protein